MLRILRALLDVDTEVHGWVLVRSCQLGSGTVYPILARLEEAGWVTSRWERSPSKRRGGRQPRRFYRVVDAHRAEAEALLAARLATAAKDGPDEAPE